MVSKKLGITAIALVSLVFALLFLVAITDENKESLSLNLNSFSSGITGFASAIASEFGVSGTSKPVAGFIFKFDGTTVAENATVTVYVNISDNSANPCFTLPSIYAGSDGSFSTNLDNLKRADNITQQCVWNVSDVIWAEANGTTVILPEGYGTSALTAIESGTGLQYLPNITLGKGDLTLPTINLISPANDSTRGFHETTFTYNVSDNRGIDRCSLYVNNSLDQTDTNITNNQTNNFTKFLVNGVYDWHVLCYDTSENSNTSATWQLTVSVNNSAPEFAIAVDDYSTAANPTNIGTNVIFRANATDPNWDNYRLVVCNSSSISQSGICADTLICQSTYVSTGSFVGCQHNTAGENLQNYSWYAFACDANNCSDYNNTNSPYFLNFHPYYSVIPDLNWSEDTQYSINISNYFSDPDNDNLTYTASNPSNITISINNTDKIATFTPDTDWNGTASATITATDFHGLQNTSNSFVLNVTNVNDPPNIDSYFNYSTLEDILPPNNWIDLHTHSSDIDNSYADLTYSIVTQTNAVLISCSIISNQYINCTNLTANQFGTNILNVSVTDGEYIRFGIANITVISVNDPPSASEPTYPPPGEESNNATPSFNGTNSSDSDGDLINYTLLIDCNDTSQDFTDITAVTLRQDSNISSWILNQSLPEGYCDWTILVCDNSNSDNACTLSNETNNITIDLTPPDVAILEPDPDEVLGWIVPLFNTITERWTRIHTAWFEIRNSTGSVVESGFLYENSTPPWSYYWDYSNQFGSSSIEEVLSIASKFEVAAVTRNFTYTVFANDSLGHSANSSINFTINQDIPSVNIIYPKQTNLNNDFTLDIRVQSHNLTASGYNITDITGTTLYAANSTALSDTQYWNWSDYIEISGWPSGTYNITAYGRDNSGANRTSTTYFELDVDAPTYSNLARSPIPTYNNDTVTLNVTWNDNNLVNLVRISHNASGTWTNVTPSNISNNYFIQINYTLLENQEVVGWRSVARDNFNNWNNSMPVQTFQVINRPPEINTSNPLTNVTWPEDTVNDSVYLNQHFYDPDGDSLTFSNTSVENISLQINQTTAQIILTPEANFTGVRYTVFSVSDGINTTDGYNVTLNVTPVNDAPYMDSISLNPNFGLAGTVVNVSASGAQDIDGDSYQMQCGNQSGIYNLCNSSLTTGQPSCTFSASWAGLQTGTVFCVLNDLTALSTEKNASFYAGNHPPSAPTVQIVPDPATFAYNLTCNITTESTDADGDPISYYFNWYNQTHHLFSSGLTNSTSHTLAKDYTSDADTINCTVTPFDQKVNGTSGSDTLELLLCDCDDCNPPEINQTIPNQRRTFGTGNWTLDLSSYKSDVEDSGASLVWSVQGINSYFMDVAVNGDLITFAPKSEISGLDAIVITLTDSDNLTDSQEVRVSINRTLEFRNGWNLFSVPILENRSVQYVLAPLGNGNYGCGHDDTPPYDCVPADGDFAGDWNIIWTQNKTGSWAYFRPDVHYSFIPTQSLQTLEVDQGYWIEMNLTSNVNLTLNYE